MKSLMGFPPCGIFDKVQRVSALGYSCGVAVVGLVLTSIPVNE